MAHSSSKFMYYSRRLTILQTNIDHAPVDGLKHLRTVNCRNRKRIKMDKLTDRPAGKRTNKPTDERMTEERERERERGGEGRERERGGERGGERQKVKRIGIVSKESRLWVFHNTRIIQLHVFSFHLNILI